MGYGDAYPGGYGEGSASDVGVVVALETDPDVWEDISDQLISGSIIRGRSSELDDFQAGTCEMLLDNDDRRFDPTYTASPLDGHILPMKRVRVQALYDGELYPLFYGYADRWAQNREGPHRGTTTLAATDAFKILARANLASSVYAQEVIVDGPAAWWRLDEEGGTVAHDTIGDLDLTRNGGAELGGESLISRDPGGSGITTANTDGWERTGTLPVTGAPLTLEAVVKTTSSNAIITVARATGFAADEAALDTDQIRITREAVGQDTVQSTVTVNDDTVHHIAGTWDAAGDIRFWVDGVDVSDAVDNVTAGTFGPPSPGYTQIAGGSTDTGAAPALIDEVAVYDHVLTPARIAAHADAVTTPWDGDLSGARIERILDAVDFPDDLRDIDAGNTTLQSAELDMSALDHALTVARTEFGRFYVQADGIVRFEEREATFNQTPVAAFSDAAGSGLAITGSTPELSDADIRNDVTVSRLEGVAQTIRDDTSIGIYQRISYTLDGLYHDDDDHSRYAAQFLLEAYAEPFERVRAMTVNPYTDPAGLWPAILGIELTDLITLEETPQHVGDPVTRTLVVEGISHMFAAKAWETTLQLSESTTATQPYWALGVAGASELGETTRLGF